MVVFLKILKKSGKRDSDPRPQPWQGCALPTELFPHLFFQNDIGFQKNFVFRKATSLDCGCKGNAFFRTGKLFLSFFSKKVPFYRK